MAPETEEGPKRAFLHSLLQMKETVACYRLSVSVDDWKSGRSTSGSRSRLIPLVARSLFRSSSLTESLEQA